MEEMSAAPDAGLVVGMALCALSGMLTGIAIGWSVSIAQVLEWLS